MSTLQEKPRFLLRNPEKNGALKHASFFLENIALALSALVKRIFNQLVPFDFLQGFGSFPSVARGTHDRDSSS